MRWGILSTGTIAKNFAQTAGQMPDVQMQAVASRSRESAEAFARAYDIPTAHDSYEALANDPNVEIVYVATPHSRHAGGHEAADSGGQACALRKELHRRRETGEGNLRAGSEKHVFVMEAFLDEVHPAVSAIEEILESGKLGEIRAVTAQYGYTTARETRKFDRRWQAARCWISACMPSALPA